MAPAILVVEDDLLMRRTLQALLEREGFTVTPVGTIAEAMGEVNRRAWDLILLDLILPDGDGIEVCGRIRERHRMPIIILSTRREIEDRVAGLETGADDYIVKPFEPAEMIARVRAQLRRAQQFSASDGSSVIRAGRLTIDPALQDALIDGQPAGLTQKEFQLVHLLATRAGKAVSRDFLIEHLWGEDELGSDKNVAVYIRRIRQKIERDPEAPEILLTVRGFGYRVAVTSE
ncbi:MAG TPA: response regulator transcription factor [Thermoanaerobaculia bacterium]|jgi:DNA-binding response OmpR family regulator|nr:response regulator transcription factor [Thermoanaerobaculia bacterium]